MQRMPADGTGPLLAEGLRKGSIRGGLVDIEAGWSERRTWWMASAVSVGTRYRQTILGPWWITLLSVAFIFGLAVLRVGLGGGDLRESIPYVGVGYIIFGLIQGGVGSAANVFLASGASLSSVTRPMSFYAFRAQAIQLLDFLHDAVVIFLIALVFAVPITFEWTQSVVVVALIVTASVGMCLWLGPLVACVPDLGPVIQFGMRMLFFLTPIFWSVDQLATGRGAWVWYNPFTYLLLAFRDPILGQSQPGAPISPLLFTGLWTVANVVLGLLVFSFTLKRIPYWAVE